ncbi:RodZ domain-containing protein [Embleya sp. NPDC001921]
MIRVGSGGRRLRTVECIAVVSARRAGNVPLVGGDTKDGVRVDELGPTDPRRIGDFEILGRLGSGGMGSVYVGRSRGGRLVAVKVIRSGLDSEPHYRARFRQEVQALRGVASLFTAAVVDADPDGEPPWLATEFIPAPTLDEAIRALGPLPAPTLHVMACGLAEALHAIHSGGTAHRDVKPANILLAADGPRIIDFGIAVGAEDPASPDDHLAARLTATGAIIGTPGYLSPEQAHGTRAGAASDVFALGCVLVFAGTGRPPFASASLAELLRQVVQDEPDLGELPEPLRTLAAGCLAKEPKERPSARALLERLTTIAPPHFGPDWLPPALRGLVAGRAAAHRPPAPSPAPSPAPAPSLSQAATEVTPALRYAPQKPHEPRHPRQPPEPPAPFGSVVPRRPATPPAAPSTAPRGRFVGRRMPAVVLSTVAAVAAAITVPLLLADDSDGRTGEGSWSVGSTGTTSSASASAPNPSGAPKSPATQPSSAAPQPNSAAPSDSGSGYPAGVVVQVKGLGNSWVSAKASDGTLLFEGRVEEGATRQFTDAVRIDLVIGNAGAVRLDVNGVDLGSPGPPNAVTRLTFKPGDPRPS